MFTSIPSLDSVLQCLLPVFTQPSFQTHIEVLLGWVMCLSKRTEYGVFQTIQADTPVSRKERHPFDRFYNFFSRSAWTVRDLAHQVAVAVVVRLNPRGLLYLVVDDTLLHKRGKHVYGLGWFRDAVASTAKRVATASGNHWVVVGLAICIPGTSKIYCLPIHAMLHLAGKNQKSEATLAKEMLQDILEWFPDRKLVFLGDGAYSTKNLLGDLDPRVTYVGVMRADAAIYDPTAAEAIQEQARTEGEEGTSSSQSEGGRQKGRPQPQWTGTVDLANGQSHGLRRDPQVAGAFVSGGLARGAWVGADSGGVGPRPAGQVRRQVSVHHRCECRLELGDFDVLPEMVDRGRLQSEQAGDEDSSSATLVPTEHREAVAVGVVDAKRDQLVVHHRGPQTAAAPAGGPPGGKPAAGPRGKGDRPPAGNDRQRLGPFPRAPAGRPGDPDLRDRSRITTVFRNCIAQGQQNAGRAGRDDGPLLSGRPTTARCSPTASASRPTIPATRNIPW